MLTKTITPSLPVAWRHTCVAQDHALCITRPRPRRGKTVGHPRTPNYGIKVYKGGGPGTLMGTQDLHHGNTPSRAQCVMPSLQLGIRGPPWRPHGISVELKEASWATKKIPENSVSTLATSGDPRADVSAKGLCPQAPRGVARAATPTVF